MASFAGLARVVVGLFPLPPPLRRLVDEFEPEARARLDEFGRALVSVGEQLQALGTQRLLGAGNGAPAQATPRAAAPTVPRSGVEPLDDAALVSFTVADAGTAPGERLYVAGDREELGHWEVRRAVRLGPRGTGPGCAWSGQVLLQAGRFQYKYLKWDPSLPPSTARWERDQETASRNREGQVPGLRAGPESFRLW